MSDFCCQLTETEVIVTEVMFDGPEIGRAKNIDEFKELVNGYCAKHGLTSVSLRFTSGFNWPFDYTNDRDLILLTNEITGNTIDPDDPNS